MVARSTLVREKSVSLHNFKLVPLATVVRVLSVPGQADCTTKKEHPDTQFQGDSWNCEKERGQGILTGSEWGPDTPQMLPIHPQVPTQRDSKEGPGQMVVAVLGEGTENVLLAIPQILYK